MTATFSSEILNSYGFWVKTGGIDLERFRNNPVLTYNHQTHELPVGKVINIRIEDNRLVGEVDFDIKDARGLELKRKYDEGYMSGFSIGIIPKVYSEDKNDIKMGQQYQTVVACELLEIAAVTIPSNSDAVRMYNQSGEVIEMAENMNLHFSTYKNKKLMLKVLILLGLSPTASEEEAVLAIEKKDAEIKNLTKGRVDSLVEAGKQKGMVTNDNEESFRKLALQDYNLAADYIGKSTEKQSGTKKDFSLAEELGKLKLDKQGNKETEKKLNEMTETEVLHIRSTNREEYKRLFFLTYGITPSMRS